MKIVVGHHFITSETQRVVQNAMAPINWQMIVLKLLTSLQSISRIKQKTLPNSSVKATVHHPSKI